jgi:energy-coupling factor transporter ATP-binding protein EcfA2
MQIENPYGAWRKEGKLFDYLKDERTHSVDEARTFVHGFGGRLGTLLNVLKADGDRALLPKYPGGRWRIKREHGLVSMKFVTPAENTGIDKEAVKELVTEAVKNQVEDLVEEAAQVHLGQVKAQIAELQKSSVPILELHRYENDKKIKVEKIEPAHEMMQYLLYCLQQGEHIYLFGPAGSGKSTAAMMAAKALKRKFGYISLTPQTFESRLFGFYDAHGKYIRTEFRDCYEKGGLFCIDEMDNGSGNLYTALNGALENNICSFPDKQVKRHEDFVVVGTGNTSGGGPNPMFPTRRPFDKAYAERFTYIEWSYDTKLERAVALSIHPQVAPIWHEYCLKLREYCTKHMPMVLVSPRAVFKGCKYMRDGVMPIEMMMHAIIFKGYDKDSVNKILAANPVPKAELDAAMEEFKKLAPTKVAAKKSTRVVTPKAQGAANA